jgi:microsomal dipeptidase-like Zn-dependent dipeptidase
VNLLGVDHVALGSDFDGTVTAPIDGSEMAAITQALMDAGADDATIRAVIGENAVRFFLENLPAE